MNLIFLGPPGAGKGTQAARLQAQYGWDHVSTGDMFRQAMTDNTPLGQVARGYIDEGELVPDDVVIAVVRERLNQGTNGEGFILDGFPRTVAQAEALSLSIAIDAVISLEVPDGQLVDRISGRRVCKRCSHTFYAGRLVDKARCPECGGPLFRRDDDEPSTVRKRLAVYHEQTEPLITYYRENGLLRQVAATGSVDDVYSGILKTLGLDG
ncbi:MAG: adenylate kinase [Clostridiales bacterium]|jgi:adenylate kinase|nr:adenylate kinase [Clostridiales bacterium]